MSSRDRRRSRAGIYVAAAVAAVAVIALVLAIRHFERLPEGPVPVAWDKASCAHCRMAVSEPRFAAQMQLVDGEVLNFDDPGCLFRFLRGQDPTKIHAIWFHHLREERWLPRDRVAFVDVSPTPMGYGIGAVDASSPGAFPVEEAERRVAAAEVRQP